MNPKKSACAKANLLVGKTDAKAALRKRRNGTIISDPSDSELIDWLEGLESQMNWSFQYDEGCVFVCRNTTGGTKTLRDMLRSKWYEFSIKIIRPPKAT